MDDGSRVRADAKLGSCFGKNHKLFLFDGRKQAFAFVVCEHQDDLQGTVFQINALGVKAAVMTKTFLAGNRVAPRMPSCLAVSTIQLATDTPSCSRFCWVKNVTIYPFIRSPWVRVAQCCGEFHRSRLRQANFTRPKRVPVIL